MRLAFHPLLFLPPSLSFLTASPLWGGLVPTPDHYIGHLSYGVCESSLGCGKSSQAGRRKCATHTGLQDMPYIYTQEMSSRPTYIHTLHLGVWRFRAHVCIHALLLLCLLLIFWMCVCVCVCVCTFAHLELGISLMSKWVSCCLFLIPRNSLLPCKCVCGWVWGTSM
jgi:hypothetical protein